MSEGLLSRQGISSTGTSLDYTNATPTCTYLEIHLAVQRPGPASWSTAVDADVDVTNGETRGSSPHLKHSLVLNYLAADFRRQCPDPPIYKLFLCWRATVDVAFSWRIY